MAIVYSTLDVHPRERLSYWLEVATRGFVEHTFQSSVGRSFQGSVGLGSLPAMGVATFACSACEVGRGERGSGCGDSDDFLLCLQLAGEGVMVQDGRQATIEAGGFILLDTRRPFFLSFATETKSVTFKIPRQVLEPRLGNVAALTARTMSPRSPVSGLAAAFLSMLPAHVDELDDPTSAAISEQALDLIALAFSVEAGQSGVALSSPRAIALLRLKSVIEAGLPDPALKPATAAAASGISVRYANALLAQEGYSIERYILHRRLERCRAALEDPRQAHRMIGEIAYSWGFSDLSHFGRRFREDFGVSPSEYRQKLREPAAADGSAAALKRGV